MTQFPDSYPSHTRGAPLPPMPHRGNGLGLDYNRIHGHGETPASTTDVPDSAETASEMVPQAFALYMDYSAEVQKTLQELPWAQVHVFVQSLVRAWQTGHHIYVMGNGGSAATATHMACDLAKNTAQPGLARMQAISLNDNIAMMSALANDIGYDQIFAEQVRTLVQPMDVVVAISTSGNSPNILQGIEAAHERKAITMGLCGYHGGKLASMVHVPVITPNHCVEQIEDIHMVLSHMVTVAVRREMQAALHRRNGHD